MKITFDKTISPQVPFSSSSGAFDYNAWSSAADRVAHNPVIVSRK